LQISFTIFGAIIGLGIAGFGIYSITKKQTAAASDYKADKSRYNREKRLDDIFKDDKK